MATPPLKDLTKLAVSETDFRKLNIRGILSIVGSSDVPVALRTLTVIVLTLFILFSFQFCILILHIICAAIHITQNIEPVLYLDIFGGEWVVGTVIAIPLIPRLGSFGESKHLEERLVSTAARKVNKKSASRSSAADAD